jgi:acetyl esterase/lipase
VADVAALARDTHKFESRYLDRLIGPWPEAEALYRERSPIYFTDRLSCPVILLQGLEDEAVPPAQAEMMAAALDAKGIPYAYLPFGGEQHGFRQAAHIRRALEAELYFYSRVFGFDLADPVEPVAIAHLQQRPTGRPVARYTREPADHRRSAYGDVPRRRGKRQACGNPHRSRSRCWSPGTTRWSASLEPGTSCSS